MDDDTAEIELLEQNLNKTRQISRRMTTILTNFDSRLVRLEKSILPLYNSTQILNRRANNIDRALLKIDDVASNQEGIAAEEALILRGPQPGQFEIYKDTLERLNAVIAFKGTTGDARDTARLVETGARRLAQLYTKLVAEGSSGTPSSIPSSLPTSTSTPAIPPFPAPLLASLRPLVAFLRTLPLPATHPTHPAGLGILNALREAQKGYAEMRGRWVARALEDAAEGMVERALGDGKAGEEGDRDGIGREVGQWVEGLLGAAESEYALLLTLAPLPPPTLLSSTYNTLLTPLIRIYSTHFTTLTTGIRRSLHRHTFVALGVYAVLSSLAPRWEGVMARRTGVEEGKREAQNEMKESLNALRGVCVRSFPEFLADLKIGGAMKNGDSGKGVDVKGGDTSVGLADPAISTVRYLERVPEVLDAIGSVLLSLGDGNWRMGEGNQVGKMMKLPLGDADKPLVIEHYITDVVSTVIASLTTLSSQRRGAFGSIFLVNNISFLRNRILIHPSDPQIPALLSSRAQESLHSAFRTAKAAYFDANFSPLMQALAEDPTREKAGIGIGMGRSGGAGSAKAAMKEKFVRFYDLLDEVSERHRMAKVLGDEACREDRSTVVEEVVKFVVPLLQKFTQKAKEKEFSKNPQKYIKLSAEEVESQIRSFYK